MEKRKKQEEVEEKTSVLEIALIAILFVLALILVKKTLDNRPAKYERDKTEYNEILYNTIYYYKFGSRKVIIYENGEVYDDLEIEDPSHKADYKLVKTLTKEELDSLKEKISSNSSTNDIDNYIKELVYGVKEFTEMGGY